MPASVEDQAAVGQALSHVLDLAAALGADEDDLRDALRRRQIRLGRAVGRDPSRIDAPA
jgi:hypothetical protein